MALPAQKLQSQEMTTTPRVVSLDPGRLSGVVSGIVTHDGALDIDYFQEIQFTPKTLNRFLAHVDPDVLVVERFTYRPKHRTEDKLDLFPCYLIGICILWQEQNPTKRLIFQEASEAKGGYYGQDDTLSQLGVYSKGGKGHARDSTRHILRWFYEGAGFRYNKAGVRSKGLTKDMRTEKQKAPKKRRPRNDGEMHF